MTEQGNWSAGYRDLWQRFSRSDNQAEYCQGWLDLQCARIPGARHGVLVLRTDERSDQAFHAVAHWPAQVELRQALIELAERVIDEEFGLVSEFGADQGQQRGDGREYGVAYPLKVDQRITGVISIGVAAGHEQELADAMENLQWGIAWIELMFRRHQRTVLSSDLPRLKSTVDILAAVLAETVFAAAATSFVTELAAATGCERASFGIMQHGRIRVKAISNSAEFGKRMNLVRLLEAAMEEAVFQRAEIAWPGPTDDPLVNRDHASLAGQHGAGNLYTLPLFTDGAYYGAVTLERGGQAFSETDRQTVRAVSVLCGAALRDKRLNDRPLYSKAIDAWSTQWRRLVGPGYPRRKLLLAGLAAVTVYFMFATDTYRVAADTNLEGAVQQAVVAPFDAYVLSSDARAGDRVEASQLLCKLDDRDLRLERLNWVSERSKLERQHEEAVARHDQGQARVLAAQLEQNQAQLSLIENRLGRTELRAPFDGLVVAGDLTQRLGGAVQQGEVLFEVTPLHAYRLVLWVDEHELAEIQPGQQGRLLLTALPDEPFSFTVQRVTPISEARDGGNFFRVESEIANLSPRLRPGMQGVAKVEIGARKQIAILSRPLLRWLKLQYWALFG